MVFFLRFHYLYRKRYSFDSAHTWLLLAATNLLPTALHLVAATWGLAVGQITADPGELEKLLDRLKADEPLNQREATTFAHHLHIDRLRAVIWTAATVTLAA